MKFFLVVLFVSILSACSALQGVPLGDGHYKFISGGKSKNEAFNQAVRIMKNTCGDEGILYEIVEQTVEGNGEIIAFETKSKKHSYVINGFNVSNTETEYENFRGYDITTIFKCTEQKI